MITVALVRGVIRDHVLKAGDLKPGQLLKTYTY
jgi:hypothetical protein